MFDFERQLRGQDGVAARESRKLSVEQQQRDVFETHRHRVFSVSYYMTANELEAEGILQNTFVQAFCASLVPDAEGVDRALLRQLEERLSLEAHAPASPEQGSKLVVGQVRRTDLEEALPVLPPRERLIFLLRDVEGFPACRIAALLGAEEVEVNRTLISARIRMRNAIGRQRASAGGSAIAEAAAPAPSI